jgi:hypothetical protein
MNVVHDNSHYDSIKLTMLTLLLWKGRFAMNGANNQNFKGTSHRFSPERTHLIQFDITGILFMSIDYIL